MALSNYKDAFVTPQQAIESATRGISELELEEQPQCSLLFHSDRVMLQPLLVREGRESDSSLAVPHFYIIPFAINNERTELDLPLVRLCILVDARTAEFQEVTIFDEPVTYLPQEAAVRVVASALHVAPEELNDADVSIMFQPGEISYIRAYPFWSVIWKGRSYYVDQAGKLYGRLAPGAPGS
jgi:hypothetical protein